MTAGLEEGASLLLIIVMGVMFGAGVYAMLERSLTRVLIGFLLLGNAANLLLLIVMGQPGVAPFFGAGHDASEMTDPLPQALTLTAIVITFGVSAFLLALIYRSWQLRQADTVQDDETDVTLREQAAEVDELEDEDIDEDDEITTDFVGVETSPIRVLHHRDFDSLRDDAPTDSPERRRTSEPSPARVDTIARTAAEEEASAPDTEDHAATEPRPGEREESPTDRGPTSEAPEGDADAADGDETAGDDR